MSTTIAATSAPVPASDQPGASRKPAPAADTQAMAHAQVKADQAAYSVALNTTPGGQVADGLKAYAPESLGGSLLSRSI